MKVLISLGYSTYVAIDGANAGPLLASLGGAQVLERLGYGCEGGFKVSENALQIEVVDDSKIKPLDAPLLSIQENAKKAETRWLEEYRGHADTKKELAALKERLQKAGIKLDATPEAAPTPATVDDSVF